MELFLNLCWLSLLLPAFLLWRRRTGSTGLSRRVRGLERRSEQRPVIFIGVLGCALILLFPVISATDDLHAMRPEMEESERAFRDVNRCSCAITALNHTIHTVLPGGTLLTPEFEQIGSVLPLIAQSLVNSSTPPRAGRAPPLDLQTSL